MDTTLVLVIESINFDIPSSYQVWIYSLVYPYLAGCQPASISFFIHVCRIQKLIHGVMTNLDS